MQIAVLDTGILIDLLKNGPRKERVNQYLESEDFTTVISVVTKAELMAIAKKRNWGDGKIRELEGLLASFVYFDIEYNNPELLNAYAAIDAFSQGRTPAHNQSQSCISRPSHTDSHVYLCSYSAYYIPSRPHIS